MNVIVSKIWGFLHFFHRPFSRFISQQQFRYLANGGFFAFVDALLFYILNNLMLHQHDVLLFGYQIKSYYFSVWILFLPLFILGFLSAKYVVFPGSHLPHGTQLFRYILLVIICFFLTNIIIDFFIDQCHLYAVVSK